MKEHHAAARLGQLEKSAVAESVLLIKEDQKIRLRPTEEINRDLGLDIPECWVHTIKTAATATKLIAL